MKKSVMVPTQDLTCDDVYTLMDRMVFWSHIFFERAENLASFLEDGSMCDGHDRLTELTERLEEKRFVPINKESAEAFEEKVRTLTDPVALWRLAKGLDNHRLALLQMATKTWPEQGERWTRFHFLYRD